MRRWLLPALLLAALVGLWQLAASTGFLAEVLGIEEFLVPSPAEIAEALWQNRSLLAENAWVTLREILLGSPARCSPGAPSPSSCTAGRRSATPPTP